MKIGVLGGGFGLYGYVPACIQNNWRVHTLSRYKSEIQARPELADFTANLVFHSDESALISEVDALIYARNPESQVKFLNSINGFRGHVYLEKPLAPTIESHEEALNKLELSALRFSVGYLLPFTGWYREIISANHRNQISGVEVNWEYDPPNALWKSNPALGGGIADYYAIHLVSLLSDLHVQLDDLNFSSSSDYLEIQSKTNAVFTIKIRVSRAKANRFQALTVSDQGLSEIRSNSISPFGAALVRGKRDSRIPFLAQYLSQAAAKSDSKNSLETERQIIRYRKLVLAERNLRNQIL